MKPSTVKYIFYGIVLFVFLGTIYTNIAGNKEDKVFKQDYIQYQQALQQLENNQLDQAIRTLKSLVEKYPEEYTLYYQLGLAYGGQEDFENSAIHYQKAIDIRPALLGDPMFTYRMGESLYNIKQLEFAKKYLSYPVPKQFEKQKDELLKLIEKEIQS